MKSIFLTILREVGIALIILVVLAAVTVFVFKDQLPYDEKVPKGEEYVRANLKTYSVSSTDRISEINAVTITHETNPGQIISAENEVRIQTGKYTPFGTIDSTSDLPSERVGISVSRAENSSGDSNSTNDTQQADGEEKLDYPEASDDPVKKIEQEQSESSESAAARRMGNVE